MEVAFKPVLLVVRDALPAELLVVFSAAMDLMTEALVECLRVHTLEVVDRGLEDVWILDFGCSRHMTGHRSWFFSLNPVSTRSTSLSGIMVKGSIWSLFRNFSMKDLRFILRRVRVVFLMLKRPLFAFCCLLVRVYLTFVSDPTHCLVASPSADIWKWHRRLGHLSFDLLVRLSSMGLIQGLPKLKAEKDLVCHPCRHGKMVAASHAPMSQVMTSYPDELLYMDTVGLARVALVSRKWYVLVVVDDFSCFSWVFFMEFKDEAFGFVRDLVLKLKNESERPMRAIRSDNSGEFRDSRFETFCRDLGLEHQFSSPYTPLQNGVVERKNRTLVEIARTMLDEFRTLRRFGAEAVNTANYIANRIFLRAFLGKTSNELQFGSPASSTYDHLGVGALCLRRRGIWIRYASSSRAFQLWIMETHQVIKTCEVSFDESLPCTTPAFELSSDDEEGTPIFEDEEGEYDDGDAGASALAAAPAPSATSSDDEDGPTPMASTSLPQNTTQAEVGPIEDAGKMTSERFSLLSRDHPPQRMISDLHQQVTRSLVNSLAFFSHSTFVASFESQDVSHALSNPNWVNAMHEKLENFERNHVCNLVEPPPNCRPIGTKWVFKNKQGENGMVGFCQKEGIDYEETFAPIARLEAIRILLAFAPSKGFKLQ
ncbi:LOW QUALITY PROTEIN: hypothetical protein U9M48_005064 [Paspalum notatum var. saurae]|uniref:Integrase catalytic domain-containing protein n=1 Tax=Paspalum notatum var. saurae TaxID=547442 RepID=A0AAQ3PLJ9_PASNO